MDSGYEIHSVDALPPKVPTLLELDLPPGFTAVGEWNVPAPVRSFNPGGGSVFVGIVKFVRKVQVASEANAGEYLLACSTSYQACSSRQCLRPVKALMSVAVLVAGE